MNAFRLWKCNLVNHSSQMIVEKSFLIFASISLLPFPDEKGRDSAESVETFFCDDSTLSRMIDQDTSLCVIIIMWIQLTRVLVVSVEESIDSSLSVACIHWLYTTRDYENSTFNTAGSHSR